MSLRSLLLDPRARPTKKLRAVLQDPSTTELDPLELLSSMPFELYRRSIAHNTGQSNRIGLIGELLGTGLLLRLSQKIPELSIIVDEPHRGTYLGLSRIKYGTLGSSLHVYDGLWYDFEIDALAYLGDHYMIVGEFTTRTRCKDEKFYRKRRDWVRNTFGRKTFFLEIRFKKGHHMRSNPNKNTFNLSLPWYHTVYQIHEAQEETISLLSA